jgi:hypothetical protein
MKRLVITGIFRGEALDGGAGAAVQLETSDGPLELRLGYQDAERLIAALHAARRDIQAERAHEALPPLPRKEKAVVRWETALDPVDQDAILLARFSDETVQETRIPRHEVGAIARFLEDAARRFDTSADLRQ